MRKLIWWILWGEQTFSQICKFPIESNSKSVLYSYCTGKIPITCIWNLITVPRARIRQAIEAIACPFQGLALIHLDHCQPWGHSLPLVGLCAFLLLCPVDMCPLKTKILIRGLTVPPNSLCAWIKLVYLGSHLSTFIYTSGQACYFLIH